jgi:hypothetical protein
VFDGIDIEAAKGGHINDASDWQFSRSSLRLGAPLEVGKDSSVNGLPAGSTAVRAERAKEDPSKKSFEEQDKA